jgi:DUF4097 and DUF4098 domain-containing protein YvlB
MMRYPALALFLLAVTSAHAAETKLDRSFKVAAGGTLVVNADGGSVHISSHDSDQLVVHMLVRASEDELANAKLEATQNDDGVTLTLQQSRKWRWLDWSSWNNEARIEVQVPRRYNVNVRTGGGGVELRDLTGAANLRTSGGDIVAKNVIGSTYLRTSGGGILAETIRGDIDANTSGGDVRLLNVDGKIRAHTSGGSVRCSLVGINRGVHASTSGGDIELTLPRGTTGQLDASTSGGSVSSEIPVSVTGTEEGQLRGPLNGGGERIEARTSGGSIRVRAAG